MWMQGHIINFISLFLLKRLSKKLLFFVDKQLILFLHSYRFISEDNFYAKFSIKPLSA